MMSCFLDIFFPEFMGPIVDAIAAFGSEIRTEAIFRSYLIAGRRALAPCCGVAALVLLVCLRSPRSPRSSCYCGARDLHLTSPCVLGSENSGNDDIRMNLKTRKVELKSRLTLQKLVEVAGKDTDALLLFSGGETRKDAGPRIEAQSYWSVAETHDWFEQQLDVRRRALTEEHARDSFENLLFSICRFRELTGSYPNNITVVSYDFKEKRLAQLHRSALRFPTIRFFYVGTPASPSSAAAALKGEALVREQFQKDPYGCSGSLHRKK